ncbi:hypothetical protein QCA50_010074 [Cerrena zonata]|uniref:Uncharacterized protein n=1 Tax=Cerrena zonata TaxID=2478898 RepID=A0AAW0G941_9APHY
MVYFFRMLVYVYVPLDRSIYRHSAHQKVEDILRMRRTSKLYFILTHEPIIWRRWIRRIGPNLPLPPLEWSTRWSLKNLSALEAERIVTRAISFDKAWHNVTPGFRPGNTSWMFPAHSKITALCLLPGSQYLIASVCDRTLKRFSLILFAMDHKFGGAVPLAQCKTEGKAFGLTARYMTVNGKQGILLAYLLRHWRNPEDGKLGVDINKFSGEHEIDPPYPMDYSCEMVHVPLCDLETLADSVHAPGSEEWHQLAESLPSPFGSLTRIQSDVHLGPITLGEAHHLPYISVVKRPNAIIFRSLNGGAMTTLELNDIPATAGKPHKIMSMRMLTEQNHVLVIRRVEGMEENRGQTVVESYLVPDPPVGEPTVVHSNALDRRWIPLNYDISQVYISDQYALDHSESSVDAEKDHLFRPRPLTVFCTTVNPFSIMRFTFYPKKADPRWMPPTAAKPEGWLADEPRKRKVIYTYNLRDMSVIRRSVLQPNTVVKIVPASMRPLIQIFDPEDITASPKIFHMWRWIHPDADRMEPVTPQQDLELGRGRGQALGNIGFELKNLPRLTCFAWDETIGRMCLVRKDAAHVDVVDMGMTRRLDWRHQRETLEDIRLNDPDRLPYWYGGTCLDSEDPMLSYCNARCNTISLDDKVDPEESMNKKGKQRATEDRNAH